MSDFPVHSKRAGNPHVGIAIVTSIHSDFDARIWKHARSVASRHIATFLVSPWRPPAAEVEGVHFRSFRRAHSRIARIFLPFRVLRQLLPIWKQLDLIHFHDLDLLPLMSVLALFKPVIYDCHENYPDEMLVRDWIPRPFRRPLHFLVRWGQWICSRWIGHLILVAPSQAKDFPLEKIHWMYLRNYASVMLLSDCTSDYFGRNRTIIFTGYQWAGNGSLLLLTIAELLRRRIPDVQILCFDRFESKEFRNEFLKQLSRRQLEGTVDLLPPCQPHELMRYLNRSRVGISPNLRIVTQINGIHTKLFEYLAAGLPVVISDLPHQVDLVTNADCGILDRPEDPGSFVVAIEELLRDQNRAYRLGQNGKQYFRERCTWESQESDLMRFYQEVLGHRDEVFLLNSKTSA